MPASPPRRVRIVYYSTWADGLEDATEYLASLPARDLSSKVSDPRDAELMRMARLDCDWDGEVLRAFAAMEHPGLGFEPAQIAGPRGLLELVANASWGGAAPWIVFTDQKPATLATIVGKLLEPFVARGGRVLYWSYDDASRRMECFAPAVAPYLSVLIHDESPLAPEVVRALSPACRTLVRSWLANIVPFAYPFQEEVEDRVVLVGSRLGITDHRTRQIRALETHFGDRFLAITDHSLPVAELGRIKVHHCPEGRFYASPAMRRTHTDRPFWAGCLGQVPVSEDSEEGERLSDLARAGLLLSYRHGDLRDLIDACERALALDVPSRRAIYDHFNRRETLGAVAAAEIADWEAGQR